jgi:hypothetical protein
MRTFAQKENRHQKPARSSFAPSHLATLGLDRREHPILHLQRAIGNQAVLRMLQAYGEEPDAGSAAATPALFGEDLHGIPVDASATRATQTEAPRSHAPGNYTGGQFVQAKLMVSRPSDIFEQEADRVADAVVAGQSVHQMSAESAGESNLQRTPTIDGQGPEPDELGMNGQPIIRRSADGAGHASATLSTQIQATLGSGHKLPEATRRELGGRMGADFNDVRVHTDPGAADMCRELGAQAFTLGRDIYFNHGRYNPQTAAGVHLLAHELTHTMQQAGPIRRLSITPTKTFTKGKCGQYSVYWNFASGVAAPASGGYIVQHIREMETYAACPDTVEAVSTTPKGQFWEAWWVAPGDKIQELHKKGMVDFTDRSSMPGRGGISGHVAYPGDVKFFSKDVTGDLGRENVLSSDPAIASVWKPGTKGGVAQAGWLPSTRSEPSWWGNSLDGPEKRWASTWWNCCDSDESKHWSQSDASPK